jgi:hypothetical protein
LISTIFSISMRLPHAAAWRMRRMPHASAHILEYYQCGMLRSNAAAACGRIPHAACGAALSCGLRYGYFAAVHAAPHVANT